MIHHVRTYKGIASIIGLVWIGACADDPKGSGTQTANSGDSTSNTSSTTGSGTSSTTGPNTSGSTSTTGADSGGSSASGGNGGGAGEGASGGIGGGGGEGASGGSGTSGGTGGMVGTGGTGGDGTGGTSTGGTGGGTGGDGTGGTGGSGTGGTGGSGTGGSGAGGTGATDSGGAGGMGEGGQGGAMPCADNLLETCGFETGSTEGWFARGGAVLTPATDETYDGAYALSVADRDYTWGGAQYDIMGLMQQGVSHEISVFVKVMSGGPANLTLTREIDCGSGKDHPWVMNMNAVEEADGWIELSGVISVANDCTLVSDAVYVEASVLDAVYYLDEPMLVVL